MSYTPKPIDTSGVTLPEELRALTELLAKNAHDLWTQRRLAEGWTYGPGRDDALKQHPCLVPYEELPESEKEYDRTMATETLKAMVALGYRIEPLMPNKTVTLPPPTLTDKEVALVLQLLNDPITMDLGASLAVWRTRNPERWSHAEPYRLLGERILKFGEPLIAHDVVVEGLTHWPQDVRLRQIQGLALARSGAIRRANEILLQLHREGHNDGETLGILARTHKDLWELATDPNERTSHLRAAYEFYHKAYRLAVERGQIEEGYYTGINAATTALLLGEQETGRTLARQVHNLCQQERQRLTASGDDTYWVLATLGEAALLLGEPTEAKEQYAKAAEAGRGRLGDLHSTRRQARLLTEFRGVDKADADIERCFQIPRVVVFTGYMIDRTDRPIPRFPPQYEQVVSRAIHERLRKLDARLGYASAACGSDILFSEAIMQLNGETHIVLPYSREHFKRNSVEIIPGAKWGERYERILRGATDIQIASEQKAEVGTVIYNYASILLLGLASIRAQQLDTELVVLTVWNGQPGDQPGGTATTVQRWQSLGHKIEVIDLPELLRPVALGQTPVASPISPPAGSSSRTDKPDAPKISLSPRPTPPLLPFPREIMAMLFADAVGFSKLTEEEIPRFVQHFLGAIAELTNRSLYTPVTKNTWGDGLYFVFTSVRDAGRFALDLCDLVNSIKWAEKRLPEDLNLRIALHAGPVYICTNPVTGQPDYIGAHVSRAARIEPITPPGHVYVSQPFAAIAAAQKVTDFTYDYVGQIPLAKGYGTFPTYHLRRRHS